MIVDERPAPDRDIHRALAGYRAGFGWRPRIRAGALELPLGGGLAALTVPAGWAGEVAHRLRMHDCSGPVLAAAGTPRRWAFLAALDDLAPEHVPYGVRVLAAPQSLVLPPTMTGDGPVRWVVPPDPGRRALPSFAAVLHAIRAVVPLSGW
ncbi:hypothetical protein CFN78_18810 [Amycolatopsis antarctica]|uniref:DNA primase/polymerase bifunctional N-terminal domain-containing protein n=1 Tax=Amycolatopsis antarctica TaxID=1854586 RepID=A0A263CZI4_9PSEU|nr:hypothetical protein [Amycolatopsis antarctica]OZM71583.1 hypothetical protein CFN78_18810 [Amycolatopsis antarctica]